MTIVTVECFLFVLEFIHYGFFLFLRGRNHVLKTFKVRRGCTVPSPLNCLSIKKSNGAEMFAAQWMVAASCRRPSLSRPAYVWTPLSYAFICMGSLPPMGTVRERPQFYVTPPLVTPLLSGICLCLIVFEMSVVFIMIILNKMY